MTALPLFILLFLAAYFLLLRPQQQRVRRQRDLVTAIGVGDYVITAGGIVGHVVGVTDDRMQLEISDGVVVEFLRLSISRRLNESEAPSWGTTGDDADAEEEVEGEEEYGEGDEEEEIEESAEGDTEADAGSDPDAASESEAGSVEGESVEGGAAADEAAGGLGGGGAGSAGSGGSNGSIEEGAIPAPGQDPH
jgi:preprotein translocase subunit YajC